MKRKTKNENRTNKTGFLYFAVTFFIIFAVEVCLAETFCVSNDEEMQEALSISAANGESDVILVVTGADLSDFTLTNEIGYSLTILGGYNQDCTERIEVPDQGVSDEQLVPVVSEEAIEDQQSTTGPVPPPEVGPKEEKIKGDLFSGGAYVTKTIGVPGYLWRHGCGPTAEGMVVGFYDVIGYSDLIAGDASTQTANVNQSIASQGSTTDRRHYEDYSLPIDDPSTGLLDDRSEPPEGDEHTHDSIADFMKTSWSAANSYYGWGWFGDIRTAFLGFINSRNSTYSPIATNYYWGSSLRGSSLTWSILKNEIDNNRPMVFLVDSDGNGSTDHFVAVVGYRYDAIEQLYQYGCLDTWSPATTIRWNYFRGMSSSYSWGIYGGVSFQLSKPVCANFGKVIYVYEKNTNSTQNYGYVFIAPRTILPNYCYYYYTTNRDALNGLTQAQVTGKTVYILGRGVLCPGTGTYRYGGTIDQFRTYSNY